MTITFSGKAADLLDCIARYRNAQANMRRALRLHHSKVDWFRLLAWIMVIALTIAVWWIILGWLM